MSFFSTVVRGIGVFALFAGLVGCAVEPATQALLDAYRINRSEGAQPAAAGLKPGFKYLRVQIDGREIFLVRGYVDQHPDGSVEVWYSADADALRLRDGRVVGVTMKSGPEWLNVSFAHLPGWDAVGSRTEFDRVRDVGPGYRYGIKEKMLLRRIAPPDNSQLRLVPASSLTWFEEGVQGVSDIPPARYAVDSGAHRVVYGEQCLSSEYCFSWQDWSSTGMGAR
ncbi:MAG: hypothetical protein WA056_08805 [Gallionella sp.]